jgi:class 3 adenylate cyclase
MPDKEDQRKLSAILFTDIVGYSKMMEYDESGTMSFLHFHNTLIRMEIEEHQGQVIKTVGDAFLADFTSAVNAVKCAISIQTRFYEHALSTGETRKVRIGIHIGDVVISENDIFGDGVNIASRLQAFSVPGGVCISGDVYHMTKHLVPYKAIPLGPKELKNVSHKVDAYQIVPSAARKHKLPAPKERRIFGVVILLVLLAFLAGEGWHFLSTPEGKKWFPPLLSWMMPTPTPVPLPTPVATPTATSTSTSTPTSTPTLTPTPKRPAKKPVVKKKPKVEPEEEVVDDDEEDIDGEDIDEEEAPAVKVPKLPLSLQMAEPSDFTPSPGETVHPPSPHQSTDVPTLPP